MNRATKESGDRGRDRVSVAGFTLIEVTIAIALLALMAAILYGAFYLAHRAVEKTQLRAEETQRVRSFGELLGGYIRSAYPYRLSARDPAIFFSGDERRLSFISAFSVGMGGRGMSKVTFGRGGEGGGSLVFEEEQPVRLDDRGGPGGYRNSVVLLEMIAAFRLDYLDSQSQDELWVAEWDGSIKKVLPRAVRFTVRGLGGEEARWIFPVMSSVLAPG